MELSKRQLKENKIIEAAESVFGRMGFKNSKMEDIASEAGITKVTLYSYFQSKENLYLAITYRAMQFLNDSYYETIERYKNSYGIDCAVALIDTFMTFCEDNYLYSEALLEYFAMVRSTSTGQDLTKLTEAERESIYYRRLQDIHNIAFKLGANEIKRGKEDGSIHQEIDPMFHTLHGWTVCVGYIKVLAASGENATPLFNVSLKKLKEYNLHVARSLLTGALVENLEGV